MPPSRYRGRRMKGSGRGERTRGREGRKEEEREGVQSPVPTGGGVRRHCDLSNSTLSNDLSGP